MACCASSSERRNMVVEILTLYYIMFEAAMAAYIPAPVFSFEHLLDFREGPCWRVCWAPSNTARGSLPAHAESAVVAAFKKWNLCDHFCYLFYEHLKKVLAREGAEVRWMIYQPAPEIFFADDSNSPVDIYHSALRVRLKGGEILMFDGTGEQFGWPASEWLTCSCRHPEFAKQQGDGEDEGPIKWTYHQGGFAGIVKAFEEQDDGYWARIFGACQDMFKNLDWQKIKREPRASRENAFRIVAKERAEKAAREIWGP